MLYFSTVILILVQVARICSRWNLIPDMLIQCPGITKTPIIYESYKFYTVDTLASFNFNVSIKRDIREDIEGYLIIDKCNSKEDQESCSLFYRFKNKKYCDFYKSSTRIVSNFSRCVHPPWRCPLQKGFYAAIDCEVDVSQFSMFPIQEAYWRLRIIGKNSASKQMMSCALLTLTVKPVK